MSVNNYKPHVLVLPEDDANAAMATGFALEIRQHRNLQILPSAGGWMSARDALLSQHGKGLHRYPGRHLVLLIDFDEDLERGADICDKVPDDLKDRVFVLGARKEPEGLRQAGLGTFEGIGRGFALECRDGKNVLSTHDLLKHNLDELARLKAAAFGIVF